MCTLPDEVLELIFINLPIQDLASVILLSHRIRAIVLPLYVRAVGIQVKPNNVAVAGTAFRALRLWRHSRIFKGLAKKPLHCTFSTKDSTLALQQCLSLKLMLASSSGEPFTLRLYNVGLLSWFNLSELLQVANDADCTRLAIYSGMMLDTQDLCDPSPSISPAPIIQLSNITTLDFNHVLFATPFLQNVSAPDMRALRLGGKPILEDLFQFLSKHNKITDFSFSPYLGVQTHNCINQSDIPPIPIEVKALSNINGPPCHIFPILLCLEQCPTPISIHFDIDYFESYFDYTRSVIKSLGVWYEYEDVGISLSPRCFSRELQDKQIFTPFQLHKEQLQVIAGGAPSLSSFSIWFPLEADEQSVRVSSHLFLLLPYVRIQS